MNINLINAVVSAVAAIKETTKRGIVVTARLPIQMTHIANELDAALDSKGVRNRVDELLPSAISEFREQSGTHVVLAYSLIELGMGDVQVHVQHGRWTVSSRYLPTQTGFVAEE